MADFSELNEKERQRRIINLWGNYAFLSMISSHVDRIYEEAYAQCLSSGGAVMDYAKPLIQKPLCDPSLHLCSMADEVSKMESFRDAVAYDVKKLQDIIYNSFNSNGVILSNGKINKISFQDYDIIISHYIFGVSVRSLVEEQKIAHLREYIRIRDKVSSITSIPLDVKLKTIKYSDLYNYSWNKFGLSDNGDVFTIMFQGKEYDIFKPM